MALRKGSDVSWKWGRGVAEGTVVEVHRDTVTRTIKGSQITRNGSDDDPAYVIEQEDGTTVLKLASELREA
jgi:hypothetical protein